ncbi:MAG: GerMN domain-containing protein [Dehalococcoidia bacterium]
MTRIGSSALYAILLVTLFAGLTACGTDDGGGGNATTTIRLAFPRSTATDIAFVEVTREVEGEAGAKRVLDLLVAGPADAEKTEHDVFNPFPVGTSVKSVTISGGVATADLSSEILGFGGGSANVIAITGAIERTLLAQPGVTSVVILVEGEADAIQP